MNTPYLLYIYLWQRAMNFVMRRKAHIMMIYDACVCAVFARTNDYRPYKRPAYTYIQTEAPKLDFSGITKKTDYLNKLFGLVILKEGAYFIANSQPKILFIFLYAISIQILCINM